MDLSPGDMHRGRDDLLSREAECGRALACKVWLAEVNPVSEQNVRVQWRVPPACRER
jgi:hypothetical protein